jgi:hypothetical protein
MDEGADVLPGLRLGIDGHTRFRLTPTVDSGWAGRAVHDEDELRSTIGADGKQLVLGLGAGEVPALAREVEPDVRVEPSRDRIVVGVVDDIPAGQTTASDLGFASEDGMLFDCDPARGVLLRDR